jgi:hypothetical protein
LDSEENALPKFITWVAQEKSVQAAVTACGSFKSESVVVKAPTTLILIVLAISTASAIVVVIRAIAIRGVGIALAIGTSIATTHSSLELW